MAKKEDLMGLVFGSLVVVGTAESHKMPSGSKTKWLCRCSCGKDVEVMATHLKSGVKKSCGCMSLYKKGVECKGNNYSHGMTNSSLYSIWENMKSRCNNKDDMYYGGRGITYDESWASFDKFLSDMGDKYSEGLTLDRIDNRLGYSKNNCRWATRKSQSRNRGKYKNNTSGHTGVVAKKRAGVFVGYLSKWFSLEGKEKSRLFSINKYGEEFAFFAACEYRDKQIALLNLQGAGYSEGHGL